MTTTSRRQLALGVRNISKHFGGTYALAGLDLEIARGEVHALLGSNGSGKSTLIKILSGYHIPEPGGSIQVDGKPMTFGSPDVSARLGMRFVHQDLALVDSLSVADNMSIGSGFPSRFGTVDSRRLRADALADLEFVGLDLDPRQPVASLGPARRAGVAIARALRHWRESSIKLLVLDEPTAALPSDEVVHLLQIVRTVAAKDVAVLYVSHHLAETFAIADAVTVLRDGRAVASGTVSRFARDSLAKVLVGADLPDVASGRPPLQEAKDPVLAVRGLSAGAFEDLDLDVGPGEIVGIAGITGSGREDVLPGVFGAAPPRQGEVWVSGRRLPASRPDAAIKAGITYLPSDRHVNSIFSGLSARENLTIGALRKFWRFPLLRKSRETAEAADWFDKIDIKPRYGYEMPMSALSGGNQQKVLLARALRRGGKVLLLADPTEGVDLGAKAEIHRHVLTAAANGMAVIVTSLDAEELTTLCHRVLVMRGGRVADVLVGDEIHPAGITASASTREVAIS